ncbi:hypothetical protein WMZ97_00735 [Lentibacillus sp. N15]|uniref:hypothetical protein n=1 Tax=Lentibacillus songyuanensis TaxID=3136161 RepID=UPI0031BA916E
MIREIIGSIFLFIANLVNTFIILAFAYIMLVFSGLGRESNAIVVLTLLVVLLAVVCTIWYLFYQITTLKRKKLLISAFILGLVNGVLAILSFSEISHAYTYETTIELIRKPDVMVFIVCAILYICAYFLMRDYSGSKRDDSVVG